MKEIEHMNKDKNKEIKIPIKNKIKTKPEENLDESYILDLTGIGLASPNESEIQEENKKIKNSFIYSLLNPFFYAIANITGEINTFFKFVKRKENKPNKLKELFVVEDNITYFFLIKELILLYIPIIINFISLMINQKLQGFFTVDVDLLYKLNFANYLWYGVIYSIGKSIINSYENLGTLVFTNVYKYSKRVLYSFQFISVLLGLFLTLLLSIISFILIRKSLYIGISTHIFLITAFSTQFTLLNILNLRYFLLNKRYTETIFLSILPTVLTFIFCSVNQVVYSLILANIVTFILSQSFIFIYISNTNDIKCFSYSFFETSTTIEKDKNFFNKQNELEESSIINSSISNPNNKDLNDETVKFNKKIILKILKHVSLLIVLSFSNILSFFLYNYNTWINNFYEEYGIQSNLVGFILLPVLSFSSCLVIYNSWLLSRHSLTSLRKIFILGFVIVIIYVLIVSHFLIYHISTNYSIMKNSLVSNSTDLGGFNNNSQKLENYLINITSQTNTELSKIIIKALPLIFIIFAESLNLIFESYFRTYHYHIYLASISIIFKMIPSIIIISFNNLVTNNQTIWMIQGIISTIVLFSNGIFYYYNFNFNQNVLKFYIGVKGEWELSIKKLK